ncbi:MAG: methylenetetrahydrofolate--tRNA-(uracil(54)-C(5))-methyltransferase (FADH(2)-oxidizing) TrmFO [Calditerrivibrio sp.]|nr:methylenetetrahydrofolate--tRNA-(uracil(54)-C(5))-methyltransferase (FADH(2)-oxidizing) TrmFO [Calditerrivibrio sp.]MCA1981142.1 methylenetetrahydrofolate--tRNA-(uracil(54)-C(5))-methyltransferase (FADH(2)-oxidizing) TrmFO [Calditerrivibrio sp.]
MEQSPPKNSSVTIIGGGLAGSEAAFQLAERGIKVNLFEMRPLTNTEAHSTAFLAELLCSNSLKSMDITNSNGLLKKELELGNSLLIKIAYETKVPSGNALSVDRDLFSQKITEIIETHPYIRVIREEVSEIPDTDSPVIIASGPLTSQKLAKKLEELTGSQLYFFDAISPIIDADSIDYSKCFFKSRYGKGEDDYLNCPMNREEYEIFYEALIKSERVKFKDFEKMAVYEKCIPIEELADRGIKTLLFGPMRPVGLEHPISGEKYKAVIQLRKENIEGTAYNIVGFQTKMTIESQKKVFRLIPGLENAEFLRFGSVHRNTYINSPKLLEKNYKMINKNIYFAGQISGVEGYVESIASGFTASLDIFYRYFEKKDLSYPPDTALYSLQNYVSTCQDKSFNPSNFHFGMLSPIDGIRDKKLKKEKMANRALEKIANFFEKLS